MKLTGKEIFNGFGFVIGITGLILSIYFYSAQKRVKALTFAANPKHTLVLSPQRLPTSKLTIFDNEGKQITRNLYSAELYLWNSGTETILGSDIIVPLVVEVPKTARLLDLQPVRVSRSEITQASAHAQHSHEGMISIHFEFRVLEAGEGMRISCLYEGQGDEDFLLRGGVTGIRQITDSDQIAKLRQLSPWQTIAVSLLLWAVMGLAVLSIVLSRFSWWSTWGLSRYRRAFDLFIIAMLLIVIALLVRERWALSAKGARDDITSYIPIELVKE